MSVFKFNNIKIGGVSCAIPKNVVRPESYNDIFGEEEVAKFVEMTGVKSTRRASKHQTASDLGYTAANELLNKKNINREEIGAVVFGTLCPDYRKPGNAFILHNRLKISTEAAVLDISLGCSAVVYGLQVVASLMNSSDIKKALLVVGDTVSKTIYPTDRASIMLAGEASIAILLEKTEEKCSPITSLLRSDGNGYKYLIVPAGGYRNLDATHEVFMCPDGNERSLYDSFMIGTSVFTFTIYDVPKIIKDFFEYTNTTPDDYDCFAFHQSNLFMLKQIAKKTKIPMEKIPLTLPIFGNTSGASSIVTLCEEYGNVQDKKLKTFVCGFGVGLSMGVSSMEIDTNDILPIIEDDSVFEEGIINNPKDLYGE